MEEKNNKKKKGNKNNSTKQTSKKVKTRNENKPKVEKEKNVKKENEQKVENTKKDIKKEPKDKQKFTKKETVTETNPMVDGNEMKNLLIIVAVVTAIFLIFYGITKIVTENKKNDNNEQTGEVFIQYDEILLGTLLEQPNSEYYVLVTKEDDAYVSTYTNILSIYESKQNSIRVYNASLDNAFNKSYEAEESKISDNLSELKLSGSTLLKIKDKKIVQKYEGSTQIVEHLNSLLK